MDLVTVMRSCNDVDEFRVLLQDQDIWLNRKAAESAFYLLRSTIGEPSEDECDGSIIARMGNLEHLKN